jgi:hypothetical protein
MLISESKLGVFEMILEMIDKLACVLSVWAVAPLQRLFADIA